MDVERYPRMETLMKSAPKERRIFRTVGGFESHGSPIVIPCQQPRKSRLRWIVVVAVLVGLWGMAMAGQLASQTLLHQGAPVVGSVVEHDPSRG